MTWLTKIAVISLCAAMFGCASVQSDRIAGTPVVAGISVAAYPLFVIGAISAAANGDRDSARILLAAPYTITRSYLEGE